METRAVKRFDRAAIFPIDREGRVTPYHEFRSSVEDNNKNKRGEGRRSRIYPPANSSVVKSKRKIGPRAQP